MSQYTGNTAGSDPNDQAQLTPAAPRAIVHLPILTDGSTKETSMLRRTLLAGAIIASMAFAAPSIAFDTENLLPDLDDQIVAVNVDIGATPDLTAYALFDRDGVVEFGTVPSDTAAIDCRFAPEGVAACPDTYSSGSLTGPGNTGCSKLADRETDPDGPNGPLPLARYCERS